ncbi:MAG: PKD domain-containing protein [Candidatus Paceibacterota bacterium]
MVFGQYLDNRIVAKLTTAFVVGIFVLFAGLSFVFAADPVAKIGIVSQDGLNISFTGEASEDPDGGEEINGWTWTFTGPGINGTDTDTGERVTYRFPEEGEYLVTLTVTSINADGITERSAEYTEPIVVDPDEPAHIVGRLTNPLGSISTIPKFLEALLDRIVQIAIPIIIIFIIYSGFLFLVAQGNPEKISKAKKTLMWTLIGAAVIIGADILAKVIVGTITDLGQ